MSPLLKETTYFMIAKIQTIVKHSILPQSSVFNKEKGIQASAINSFETSRQAIEYFLLSPEHCNIVPVHHLTTAMENSETSAGFLATLFEMTSHYLA